MSRFYISDTHFGHENTITKFKRPDGTPLRDFSSAQEMDEFMITQWNKTVGPKDTIVHLGDVAMHNRFMKYFERLNGRKILIRGNHDTFKIGAYLRYFEDVRALDVKERVVFTHIPIHPDCLERFRANVHGHLHINLITKKLPYAVKQFTPDPRYINVSVEQINYTPISHEDLMARIAKV